MSGKVKTLDALTGLRFIAALAVFIHHVTGHFGIPDAKVALGAPAVSFFFVLSGFILTYVYHDRLKWGGVKKFYFTRWARIWPLHLVCLLLMLGLAHNLRLFSTDPQHWGKLLANLFLVQSWVPESSYVFGFNGVSWSISTEMFFYLMFPLLLLGGQKQFWYKYIGLMLLMVVLVTSLTMLSHTTMFPGVDYVRLGHNTPLLRLPEFCTGMAIGFIYLNREKVKAAMPVAAQRSFTFDTLMEFIVLGGIVAQQMLIRKFTLIQYLKNVEWGGPFLRSFFMFTNCCFIFAAVIYVFSKSNGLISRLCSTRTMVLLGEVSFAFYMIHMLVIRLAMKYAEYYGDLSPILVGVSVGLISLAASIFLFKIVEMPGKNGLLAMYDGNWMKGLATGPKAVLAFSKTRLGFLTVLMAVGPAMLLMQYKSSAAPSSAVTEIVSKTEPQFRGVKFDKSVELLGYDVIPKPGGWEILLVWQKQAEFDHARYVHVLDANGELVGHGPREEDRFREAKIGDKMIDKFYMLEKHLAGGSAIGIGFHQIGVGMMRVKKGPRSMRNRRLNLISPEKFAELAAVHKQEFSKQAAKPTNDKTIKR